MGIDPAEHRRSRQHPADQFAQDGRLTELAGRATPPSLAIARITTSIPRKCETCV